MRLTTLDQLQEFAHDVYLGINPDGLPENIQLTVTLSVGEFVKIQGEMFKIIPPSEKASIGGAISAPFTYRFLGIEFLIKPTI